VGSARALGLVVLVAGAWACARPAASAPASTPAAVVDLPPPPAAPPPLVDPAVRTRADQAVERWAAFLEDVDSRCRTTWTDDASACDPAPRKEVSEAYAAFYADGGHADPHADEGRADALPRLGADRATAETIAVRMRLVCEDRCSLARRTAIVNAIPDAAEACAKQTDKAMKACAVLRTGHPKNDQVEQAVDQCESECDTQRHWVKVERERPKNRAQQLACLKKCVVQHPGARLVIESPTRFHLESTGWCGTSAFTCAVNCSTPDESAPLSF
jgi:hypothetical protein